MLRGRFIFATFLVHTPHPVYVLDVLVALPTALLTPVLRQLLVHVQLSSTRHEPSLLLLPTSRRPNTSTSR